MGRGGEGVVRNRRYRRPGPAPATHHHAEHCRRRDVPRAVVGRDERVRLVRRRPERLAPAAQAHRDALEAAGRRGRVGAEEPQVDAAAAARAREDGPRLAAQVVLEDAVRVESRTPRGRGTRDLARSHVRSIAAPEVVLGAVAVGAREVPPEPRAANVGDGTLSSSVGRLGRPRRGAHPFGESCKGALDDRARRTLGRAARAGVARVRKRREDGCSRVGASREGKVGRKRPRCGCRRAARREEQACNATGHPASDGRRWL